VSRWRKIFFIHERSFFKELVYVAKKPTVRIRRVNLGKLKSASLLKEGKNAEKALRLDSAV
jgi:hypothetical protein